MKKILLSCTALLAVVSTASAADLAARPYTKAPVVALSPATNWSGFYIGAMGGYGWSNRVEVSGIATTTSDIKGGFGGGTVGWNWQAPGSQFVFGIEVDAAGADLSYSDTSLGILAEEKIRAFGSVTGRVGMAFNSALLYVKGGYAWADNKVAFTGGGFNFSDSKLHSGYTVGAGLEYMFVPNWSAKVEYMYADYGRQTYFNAVDFSVSTHTIKAGINYHFNWGGPVVAGY
ncbi:outer membrane protein [Bradyrhizobium sp. WD16]|uniref:outer membrane protein n=1 Tax=Bradyrhizobium sp. WD16 TaxID=1521768 RepID=UPI0020A33E5A|nr:outer membrane protein [Bradyrhizobium sp. WD16]UTD29670.1 porin family protein [Bradyrhizobium sp. WD16]